MNVTIDQQNGYVLVRISGSIDSTLAGEFFKKVRPFVEQQESDLFLDLSGTEYATSGAIGEFIKLQRTAIAKSRRVVLISPMPLVRTVLSTMHLDTIMPAVDNVNAAISTVAAACA